MRQKELNLEMTPNRDGGKYNIVSELLNFNAICMNEIVTTVEQTKHVKIFL